MSYFLNTRGKTTLGIGICDRCKFKFPLEALSSDQDKPGLRVCKDCNDLKDPWRLTPRQPERVTVPFPRPDVNISVPNTGSTLVTLEAAPTPAAPGTEPGT